MASSQPPSSGPGLFALAAEPSLPAAPPAKKHRGSGRRRDPVWELTTVFADKRVVCNRCGVLIHRYGVAKVERVRGHFERKCPGQRVANAADGQMAIGAAPQPIQTEAAQVLLVGGSSTSSSSLTSTPRQSRSPGYGSKSGAFKRKLAHWLYATGQPLELEQSELLLGALRVLRGDAALPSLHELQYELLDLEAAASKSKVSKALGGKRCCLMVETRADAGGQGVTTFGALGDGVSYFLGSKMTANQLESGAELPSDELEALMNGEKKAEFCGVVTPTTATLSQHTRERIQKKHPRCAFFHGCACSALSLLLKDVSSVLPWLEKVQAAVAELVDVFHGDHKLQGLVPAPEGTSKTEFPDASSVCTSLDSVLKHEKELCAIVARRDFVEARTPVEQDRRKRVQDFVLGESFVQDLNRSLAMLLPLQDHLRHFQEDRPPLSQVYPYFMDLLTAYSSMEWVSKKEKALITSCILERLNGIYGDSHGVAYMLDPLYLGEALGERKKQGVEDFMVRFCEREGHTVDILNQLDKYKAMVIELKGTNEAYWHLLQSGAVTPRDFWVERRAQFPHLHQLAVAVFALPASSISPSPSFGEQSFAIRSRFNRTLSVDQLQKLTHVYCNAKLGGNEVSALVSEIL
jgi:hypothetical protein